MAAPLDANTEVPHALLRRPVRDIASGAEGTLMAVRVESVAEVVYPERWAEIAYIRPTGGGLEVTTTVANVEAR